MRRAVAVCSAKGSNRLVKNLVHLMLYHLAWNKNTILNPWTEANDHMSHPHDPGSVDLSRLRAMGAAPLRSPCEHHTHTPMG